MTSSKYAQSSAIDFARHLDQQIAPVVGGIIIRSHAVWRSRFSQLLHRSLSAHSIGWTVGTRRDKSRVTPRPRRQSWRRMETEMQGLAENGEKKLLRERAKLADIGLLAVERGDLDELLQEGQRKRRAAST
jgi:hypothetical protein